MIGLAELILIAACVAVGAFFVARVLWPPRRAVAGDPACAACGYSAIGLASFICPECGNDLRRVGILTPHTVSRRTSFAAAAVSFTVLWGFVAVLVGSAVAELTPALRRYYRKLTLSSPASGVSSAVQVLSVCRAWGDLRPNFSVPIEFPGSCPAASL